MIIGTNDTEDVNDIEPDENAEEANDDTKMQSAGSSMIFEDTAINEVDEIERQANAQRELIKKTLLAKPIYSPEDDDDDDENDENESAKANRRARRSHHKEGEESEGEIRRVYATGVRGRGYGAKYRARSCEIVREVLLPTCCVCHRRIQTRRV